MIVWYGQPSIGDFSGQGYVGSIEEVLQDALGPHLSAGQTESDKMPEEDDGLGSRCIYCGEPFSAHEVDWCSSEEEAAQMKAIPGDHNKVVLFRKKDRKP
ncbi:hypothetical protein [Bradyrhizobium sp.]|uniref:hypothetical protein n=1 Tax=Bradyrhizobium sp. TaxID=376 RepID=UPI0007C8BA33|nr:hypothetical protein [Bradyrhizobium sp.]